MTDMYYICINKNLIMEKYWFDQIFEKIGFWVIFENQNLIIFLENELNSWK